ncbi:hypothetical protein BOTCAL_0038g00020 [Botryotinia calthae]|uniref:Uncharacterized protein n=1 Tax=Botryotinia calthae TaxID=38488 RepID=A0A4Y8DEZ1_9HELO|nr:hypothetical protein BOTCAL_0038g00020 [Botryotinia calthae]
MLRDSFDIYLASLNKPRNYALWTKLRVLSHHWDRNSTLTYDNEPIFAKEFSDSSHLLSPERFMVWNHVEPANFKAVSMTLQGTAVFKDSTYYALADERVLGTEIVLLTEFENNGALRNCMRVDILLLRHLLNQIQMSDPILDIFEKSVALSPPLLWRLDKPIWKRMIEGVAPGYLDAEAAGNGLVVEYDHTRFVQT